MTALVNRQPNRRIIAPYDPLPWQIAPWQDRSAVLLLTGAAGGGKSRFAAEKIHAYCLKYSGATAVIARKVKASMAAGTMLFLRRKVVGNDPNVRFIDSPKSRFEYKNGSILQFIGMQDENARENLRSIGQDGAIDIFWGEEATQFEEEDHNALIARMRGKAAPWRQMIYTCNPGPPLHWIYRRLIQANEASVYYSSARDNPHNPADYLASLERLTGVDYERLVLGKWVQAEGVVYDVWRDATDGNVTEDADYLPNGGPIYWAMDDGYSAGSKPNTAGLDPTTRSYVADSHPRVILLVQQRADGRLCVFHESYACLKLSDTHINEVLDLPYPAPEMAVHGPGSAEIRGRLMAAGIQPYQCSAQLVDSIPVLRSALAPDSNGWRQILVHPRCTHLRQEMASYRYDQNSGKPLKQFDHGCDALRGFKYVVRDWI